MNRIDPGIAIEIGAQQAAPTQPRCACPYCQSNDLRTLTADDFPAEKRSTIARAMREGATMYECVACGVRYAVQTPRPKLPMNRHQRRRAAALARRGTS